MARAWGGAVALVVALGGGLAGGGARAQGPTLRFPKGTATPSKMCGRCHQAIYREYALGFGGDSSFAATTIPQEDRGEPLALPAGTSAGASAHAFAGVDTYSIHARDAEDEGRSCNVCHFPQAFSLPPIDTPELAKPKGRAKADEHGGLTCASCHLTPEGKIRGPYEVHAPHATVVEPAIQTASACATCHSKGQRVSGKQTQTFFEWREDFHKPGLGAQQCQDCHMPRTLRRLATTSKVARPVARHLWTSGHSKQRLTSALGLVITRADAEQLAVDLHVLNLGAGHSVPTGSNRRGLYLEAQLLDARGAVVASKRWMFAPWFGPRPDDRRFLAQDKASPHAVALTQADAQGPHEPPIRAGEERVLRWRPPHASANPGRYTVQASLVYDLNRYNDRALTSDQTRLNQATLAVDLAVPR